MQLNEMIIAVQQELGIQADGKAGPQTWNAIYQRIVNKSRKANPPVEPISPVDSRSEKVIATLEPEVQNLARCLVHQAAAVGITIKVISGLRSYEEQSALYAKGRTTEGPIVTNAKAGYSNHNFGMAFDIGVFEGTKYLGESPKYRVVGAIGMELGLEWGGSWKTIKDEPHFQLRPQWAEGLSESKMLAEMRARVDNGQHAYA